MLKDVAGVPRLSLTALSNLSGAIWRLKIVLPAKQIITRNTRAPAAPALAACPRLAAVGLAILLTLSGCSGWAVTDPVGAMGRWKSQPGQQPILKTLSAGAEAGIDEFPNAVDPTPEDLFADPEEYVIGPGDTIDVQIFELRELNQPYFERVEVNDLGYITIQYGVGEVKADGLTASQLTERIKEVLYPNILRDPQVGVLVVGRTQRTFAIVGAVREPLRYRIDKPDYRLLDALAQAQDISQLNIPYIYVIRREKENLFVPGEADAELPSDTQQSPALPEPINGGAPQISPEEQLEQILESIPRKTASEPAPDMSDAVLLSSVSYDSTVRRSSAKLVTEKQGASKKAKPFYWPATKAKARLPFAGRVIRIPLNDLRAGNANYNILVRKDDVIHVPLVEGGFYYVMGNANLPGTYNISGIPVTLTRAIAAAGGLNAIAEPAKVDIVRRIGDDRQQIVQIHLGKIFSGTQPDYYIKKDDIINIGTSPASPWLAVLRNGFRATYGFGFVYDRNYADRDFGRPFELPNFLNLF